jgi:hypothetical protein
MMVQEALNTAVEGGYHIYGSDGMDTDTKEPRTTIPRGRGKITSPRFSCPRKRPFLIQNSGKPWDVPWAGVRCVTSRSPVCMWRKSVSVVMGTTGCINGIVLFKPLRMATLLKPSLPILPPRRQGRAGKSTRAKLDRHTRADHSSFFLQKKFVSTHNTYARRRQWYRKSPKTWCGCLSLRGTGGGMRDVLHG